MKPSAAYVLQKFLEILGPLVSVISAIKYRFLIYLYLFKSKYIDSREERVEVGKQFKKRCPVLGDQLERAQKLLGQLES